MTAPAWDGRGTDPWLPARLEARVQIAAAERSIRDAVWAALSAWVVKVARAVLRNGGRPDVDAVWTLVPEWQAAVRAIVTGPILELLGAAYRTLFGDDYSWDQRSFVVRYLAEVENRLVRVPDQVFDLIASDLAEGINLGEGIPELSRRVDASLSISGSERWPNRATVIARTECLPGDAIVNGAYVTSAYRRAYSGPMVTVETMGGRQFTGTPNHPVLTPHGWVGLGALLEGDHLICDAKSVQSTGAAGDQDVDAGHATIAEVFHAAEAVAVPRREQTGQPDFHGDGQNGYVDVLRSFGVLPVGRFAAIDKGSVDLLLPPSDAEKVTLACLRAPFARSAPIDQAPGFLSVAPGETCGRDDALDDLQVCPVHGAQGLAGLSSPVSGHDLLLGEVGAQGPVLAAAIKECLARVGQGPDYAAFTDDAGYLVLSESRPIGHLPVAQPGQVELDEVVSVEVSDWSGHVFNLTTVHGYFVSGGIYTGNTIGAMNAGRSDAFAALIELEPDTEFETVWLATDDRRTRHTHNEADGQRVPVGQPFTVGGFELRFPGDPSGPPQEVIQCRCVALLVEVGETVDMSNRQMRRTR